MPVLVSVVSKCLCVNLGFDAAALVPRSISFDSESAASYGCACRDDSRYDTHRAMSSHIFCLVGCVLV